MNYHYTYRITNIKEKKYYYGVHSCDCYPKEDIGIKYFSSSKDKAFIKDQKENKSNYKYKVIKIFSSRKEAAQHEIYLHTRFNVKAHKSFYNRSNQTQTSFDTTGKLAAKDINTGEVFHVTSEEYKSNVNLVSNLNNKVVAKKLNSNYKLITTEEYKTGEYLCYTHNKIFVFNKLALKNEFIEKEIYYNNKENYSTNLTNKICVYDGFNKILVTKDEYYNNKEKYKTRTTNNVMVKENGKNYLVTKEEFKNRNLVSITKDKVNVKNYKTGENSQVSKIQFDSNSELVGCAFGTVTVKNLKTNKTEVVTQQEFNKNRELYVTGTQNKIRVIDKTIIGCKPFYIDKKIFETSNKYAHINNNAKRINIFDNNDNLIYQTNGNFKKVCLEFNLPFQSLCRSYRNNGNRISCRNKKFSDWYAKYV